MNFHQDLHRVPPPMQGFADISMSQLIVPINTTIIKIANGAKDVFHLQM